MLPGLMFTLFVFELINDLIGIRLEHPWFLMRFALGSVKVARSHTNLTSVEANLLQVKFIKHFLDPQIFPHTIILRPFPTHFAPRLVNIAG